METKASFSVPEKGRKKVIRPFFEEDLKRSLLVKWERMVLEAGAVGCLINNSTQIDHNLKVLLEGCVTNFRTWWLRYDSALFEDDRNKDLSVRFPGSAPIEDPLVRRFAFVMCAAMMDLDSLLRGVPITNDTKKIPSSSEINELLDLIRKAADVR